MNFSIPDFIPFPSSETIFIISVVFAIIGTCLVGAGVLLYFVRRKKGEKTISAWICFGIGTLLLINHGIQLLMELF